MFAHFNTGQAAAGLTVRASPEIALALLFLAVTTPSVALLLFIKASVILPALSLISLVVVTVIAVVAWATTTNRASTNITLWDVSGAYALVGFAAGMLSEPMQVVELISFPTNLIGDAQ